MSRGWRQARRAGVRLSVTLGGALSQEDVEVPSCSQPWPPLGAPRGCHVQGGRGAGPAGWV